MNILEERGQALGAFVTALGLNPNKIESIEIGAGVIRVNERENLSPERVQRELDFVWKRA